jgi:hypothetical protein
MRRILLVSLALVLATGVVFIVAIVADLGSGFSLHEVAGSILLVLLLLALWAANRLRLLDRRPLVRVAVALVALIVAGVTGASLAIGVVPTAAAGLPLIPLGAMLVSAADGLRITYSIRLPRP